MTEGEEIDYIKLLADNSRTDQHELIEEMLIFYKVQGTRDLTKEQIKSYALERIKTDEIEKRKQSNYQPGFFARRSS